MNNPFELPQLFTLGGVAVTQQTDLDVVIIAVGCTNGGGCHYGGGCSSGGV